MIRLLVLLLASLPGWGAIAFVNGSAAAGATMGAISVTGGNMLVACAVYQGGGASVTVSDTAGNTYVSLTPQLRGTDSAYGVWCHYSLNVTGAASNVVVFAGPSVFEGAVVQYSGVATSSALDVTGVGAAGNSNTATTASFTTSTANQLILSATPAELWGITSFTIGGVAANSRVTSPSGTITIADRIVSSIQSGIAAVATNSSAQKWAILAFSFKEAAAGGGRRRITLIQ